MPTLPFSEEEHLSRQSRLRERLREQGFDAMLVFAQESHFWLTGYDTGGYVFFQCAVVTARERPIVLLTRRPDLLQARQTSMIEDIRIWWDAEDANPAADLTVILAELGLAGKRIAVELNTHGLTGWNLWRLQQTLAGFCTLDDDGHMIRRLRLLKSPAEIAYMRKAGELLDRSLGAVIEAARPGILDSTLKGVYLTTILDGGADMPPNAPLFNSGPRAVFGRGVSAPRRIEPNDQILVEFPVAYRRYNVKTEWTILFGSASDQQRRMYDAARGTLARMTEIARPGTTLGQIFDVHADGLDRAGFRAHRYGATGYSVGCTFAPTSMDVPPMIYHGNPTICAPGMTLFYHVMIGDSDTGYAMGVGHTLLVTEGAPELLTGLPDELTVIT
ncbi:MAG: aminopeptidase P family protein [Methylobacterium sp.]|nr:aminopeptidase P family protein [Methylobacterium sp.]MCA3610555.1 aminopeptidase P family protein [Methylobacterium sp.]MCA3619034.1 aminopeptidase P family protein [Methylobacterium sp.]MCA3619802.1 aminopeptidase P family protein [Methylobacterium sp.]